MILSGKKLIFTLILIACSLSIQARMLPADSIGTRTIDQKLYIVHKVERGETLYALSRRYNVNVNSIIDSNPGSQNGINVGQELIIPTQLASSNSPVQNQDKTSGTSTQEQIVHRVASGESLYTIGQKYGVRVNDIKRWNKLRGNTISVGQNLTIYLAAEKAAEINRQMEVMETHGKKIHIVSRGETLFSISNLYNISVSDLKEWNRLESNTISVGQELIIGYLDSKDTKVVVVQDLKTEESQADVKKDAEVHTIPVPETGMQKAESSGDVKKVVQKGIAQVIEGSEGTKKYLALHREAAIGTIMQIKNEMNDLSVFVRVIGKIPDTDDNRNIMVKVTQIAYDRLGAIDEQFPVEITYHP